jgi:hypothetical protein
MTRLEGLAAESTESADAPSGATAVETDAEDLDDEDRA